MNRRDFLKSLCAVVVASQVPLSVAAEKPGQYCIRHLRAFDLHEGRMFDRVDIAKGLDLPLPKSVAKAEKIGDVSRAYVRTAIQSLNRGGVPAEAIAALEGPLKHMQTGQIIGVSYPV